MEILGKIGFDWHVALANLVNFLIIFFVLKKFAFGPIGNMIRERREKIEKGISDAQVAEKNLSVANMQKEDIIREARVNADKIVAGSTADGKEIVKNAKAEAENEKSNILASARAEAEKAKQGGEEEVRREAAKLVTEGVKKMVESYVAEGKGDEIISAMLKKA